MTSLLPSEIVRKKPVQVVKIDRVVVARRMQHHAVRRRPRLFVADIGVAHETGMVMVPSPISSPQASQRPSTSWKRSCFVASENDRAAVRRTGFGHPARLRSAFIWGDLSYLLRRRPRRQRTDQCRVLPRPYR